jgi:uncharacterized damage-inducible protein DinB
LATSDVWFLNSVVKGSFAFDPEAEKRTESQFRSVSDVVAYYEREFPARLAEVREMDVERLLAVVDFFGAFQWPNVSYLGLGNNHSVHHRGQLAAYLRPMGSKVPAICGGSADEPMAG